MSSLKSRHVPLAEPTEQLRQITKGSDTISALPLFSEKLAESGLFPLRPTGSDILQMNLGKMCNQTCRHCHVDAGPDRREIMSQETMVQCLAALDNGTFSTVDLTGGAPEMNPHFRWLVGELSKRQLKVIVRCNLTIIEANEKYLDLPQFFASNKINVVSSLPFYQERATYAQRGGGVFVKSLSALKRLNHVGYGIEGSGLQLDLVYNPAGAFLPGPQARLESDFRAQLNKDYGIHFNHLFTITNMPISRFLEYLIETDNLEDYLVKLVGAYNPAAAAQVMCRNTISVGWDGYLYDCDFNQMLDLKVAMAQNHISQWRQSALADRAIVVHQHCFGCTAGSGSSCGGQLA